MADFHHETDRLILRDWRDEDWDPFYHHTNTPAVMRWLGGVMDEAGKSTARLRLESYQREHGFTFWVVERKPDGGHLSGEFLGFCGFKRSNLDGGPIGDMEIGWRLREDAWGKGYALEAAQACMALGFTRFDAPHMLALTVDANEGSWGLMRRLGMRRRTDLDFANTAFDPENGIIIVYSITRGEWDAARAQT